MKKGPNLDPVFEKLGKLPKLYRILIAVAILLIPVGCFVGFSYMPQWEEIKKLNGELKKVKKELKEARKKAAALESVKAEMEKAKKQFAVAKKKLPENQDMPEVLKGISTAGRESGMTFSEFRPVAARKSKKGAETFYEAIPINITVSGGFHNFLSFCDLVARMPRIVNITDVAMTPGAKRGAELSTKCTAVTYKFVGEKPAAKKGKKGKKKKRKKKKGGH